MTPLEYTAHQSALRSHRLRPSPTSAREAGSEQNGVTRSAPATLTFDAISERDAFAALSTDWKHLFARAGRGIQVFQSFDWLWHWCNHFLEDKGCTTTLHIVTGRRHGKLVLVWPLAVQKCRGVRHLMWMGHPVSQYGDVLCEPAQCTAQDLEQSFQYVIKTAHPDVVHLRKVRADAACSDLLHAAGARVVMTETAPFLDLKNAGSFAAYQKRYSSKARKNRRRLRRRISERAPLSSKTLTDGGQRGSLAETAVVMKRTWLQSRGLVSPAIQSEKTRRFFRAAAGSVAHPTGCRTSILKVGSQPAALEVSFCAKAHCAVHIIVYNTDFEKAGVGVLLMEDMIQNAIESGVTTLDLLAPGDNYKLDWADGSVEVRDWTLAVSRLGRLHNALKLNLLPIFTKSVLSMLPLLLRRRLTVGLNHLR